MIRSRSAQAWHQFILGLFIGATLMFLVQDIGVVNSAETTARPAPTGVPKTLLIPRIALFANVQQIGVDASGAMDVPDTWSDVGWYKLGPQPGQAGSAVMVGHLDTDVSKDGVFWHLHEVSAGDVIEILDTANHMQRFKVVGKRWYSFTNAPIDTIFGSAHGTAAAMSANGATQQPKLNLITCAGAWNSALHTYDQRLVVYTEREAQQ